MVIPRAANQALTAKEEMVIPQGRRLATASGGPPRDRLSHAQQIWTWGPTAHRVDRRSATGVTGRNEKLPRESAAGNTLSPREQRNG